MNKIICLLFMVCLLGLSSGLLAGEVTGEADGYGDEKLYDITVHDTTAYNRLKRRERPNLIKQLEKIKKPKPRKALPSNIVTGRLKMREKSNPINSESRRVLADFGGERDTNTEKVVVTAKKFVNSHRGLLSLAEIYNMFEYGHQLIYLDTRSDDAKNKAEVKDKVWKFGTSLGDEVLVIVFNSETTETRKAFAKILKHWGIDPSIYSPSDGPFLMGHIHIEKDKSGAKGKLHIIDFSGMNTACMKDYIDNIQWSFYIGKVGDLTADQRWAFRSLICEGSKIVSDGYAKSINEAFQYFKAWFKRPF